MIVLLSELFNCMNGVKFDAPKTTICEKALKLNFKIFS